MEDRYKPAGKHTGVIAGKRDGFENFLVHLQTTKEKKLETDVI